MIDIICGSRKLQITPYERQINPDYYDLINVWVEFLLPELKTQFKAELNLFELLRLREGVANIYQNLLSSRESPAVYFKSDEKMLNIAFMKIHPEHVAVHLVLMPENHTESVTPIDNFYLDQSYFPALLSGLDEIINWQN